MCDVNVMHVRPKLLCVRRDLSFYSLYVSHMTSIWIELKEGYIAI